MPPITRKLDSDSAIEAARVLNEGGLVAFPTETVYGVFASTAHPAALDRVRSLVGQSVEAGSSASSEHAPIAWHAASCDHIAAALALPTRVHKRLIRALLPGPVRFVIEHTAEDLRRFHAAVPAEPGVFDDGSHVAIRLPGHSQARAMLAEAQIPVAAAGIGGVLQPDLLHDVELAVDAGRIESQGPSTTVRLGIDGSFTVDETGSVREADVLAALQRRVLFVCTGNTCRSPMAEAIARAALASAPPSGVETRVGSAGVATSNGMGATPEAIDAAAVFGGDLASHRSSRLTPAMIDEADAIFCMTASHADAAISILPAHESKIRLLDEPDDIADPIGMSQAVYNSTAERIFQAVTRRLAELDAELDAFGVPRVPADSGL